MTPTTTPPSELGAASCSGASVSLRVQRLREALQRPEYKAKKAEELRKRKLEWWSRPGAREHMAEKTKKQMANPLAREFASRKMKLQAPELEKIHSRWWTIRSPKGRYYHFFNLAKWCRQNEHLFDPTTYTGRLPLWKAYAGSIRALKLEGCSFHGWTLVGDEQYEGAVFGCPQNKD
jgi:hypothetical protein